MSDDRPIREYMLRFKHKAWPTPLDIPCFGPTPCLARGQGFLVLEAYLRSHPELPDKDWKLEWQQPT